ncbi:MAG: N-methyl-L-tryptophan oxidase [Vicinamibacterales bacterium]|nr:N-methyl-L-tryptophan oxidase [Vicinamibacterales bacterium]
MTAAARPFDVIVVGLGAMGSAAAAHLAARGQRVLGLEQYQPAHDQGSSHGHSRVIRLAYFEHPSYVPLLRRAYALWGDLERETGTRLLTVTGGLMVGRPDSEVVRGTLESARLHDLPHETLDAGALQRRFPTFTPAPDLVGVFEPHAGVLRPEACVQAHLAVAASHGADLRFGERVTGWTVLAGGDGVEVQTQQETHAAGRLVLAPGAWAPDLFALPQLPLEVERQVLFWLDPVGGTAPFTPDRFPVYVWDHGAGVQVYGFPAQDGLPDGVKVAFFRTGRGTRCTPQTIDREVHASEVTMMREAIADVIPSLAGGELRAATTCMYTLTPDHHFVIGPHPRHPQVILASPCSGHGFKFASVVGEILADLATAGTTAHPIALFDPLRFAGTSAR